MNILRRASYLLSLTPGATWSTWDAFFYSFSLWDLRLLCSATVLEITMLTRLSLDLPFKFLPLQVPGSKAAHLPLLQARHNHLIFLQDNIRSEKISQNLNGLNLILSPPPRVLANLWLIWDWISQTGLLFPKEIWLLSNCSLLISRSTYTPFCLAHTYICTKVLFWPCC